MANSSPAVIATNTKVVINSAVLSADLNQVKLAFTQAVHDVSTFGTSWKEFIAGLAEAALDITGFFNNAALKSDAILWAMLGAPTTSTTWEVDVPNSSVGSTRYSGSGYLKSYSPDGAVDGPWKYTGSIQVTSAPVRATIAS